MHHRVINAAYLAISCFVWLASQPLAIAQQKAALSEAQSYLGLTEAALIAKLGQPQRVVRDDSPDGYFKLLEYSKEKGLETFFIIFESDGIVQSGSYKGTLFHDKQKR